MSGNLTIVRFLSLSAVVLLVASATAADESRYALPRPSTLTPEQQERVLKAFAAAEAPLRTFMQAFPNATFSMVRSGPKTAHLVIATTLEFGRYSVALVYSGDFDPEFRRVERSRCDLFGAYDNERELRPKERRKPLPLSLDEMAAFGREPEAFLQRRFAAER